MDFRQMHYIQTIAQEGTISRAAQKLFISQPSLSQLLRGVEQKVGAPLFDRGTSPLQPTAVGRLYLRMAAQMAQLRTDFQQQTDDLLHQSRGRVIIGSSPFRSAYLLAPFLPGLQACYPELESQLKESITRQLERLCLNGDVDFATSLAPIDASRFATRALFQEEIVAVLPATHPLAKKYGLPTSPQADLPEIALAELADTPFIQIHQEQKLHAQILSLCSEAGFTPRLLMTTSSLETAQALAGAGLGAALLPITQCRGFTPTTAPCYAALRQHPRRQVLLCWRQGHYLPYAARTCINELTAFCLRNYPQE